MAAKQIKIIIISNYPEERNGLLEILAGIATITVIGRAETEQEAHRILSIEKADLFLIGADTEGNGYKVTARLAKKKPARPIILIERELSRAAKRTALAFGACDLVIYPFDFSQLLAAIYQAVNKGPLAETYNPAVPGEVRTLPPKPSFTESSKPASPDLSQHRFAEAKEAPTVPQQERAWAGQSAGQRRGQLLTFFSSKGGVGKTFCSVNLAVLLAWKSEKKVALVDLDMDYGSAALILNIDTQHSLVDLVKNYDQPDAYMLENYLEHHCSGLRVLPGGSPSRDKVKLNRNHVAYILSELLMTHDYVVIDMPTRITGFLTPAIDLADLLFAITTPDISGVRNIRLFLKMLSGVGYPRTKIRVLLNREDSKTGISPANVEHVLKEKLYAIIPADYRLATLSLNRGSPIVQLYQRSKVARAFGKLALKLVEKEN